MSSLHTINRSPSRELLETCASLLMQGDAVLFIEDGVYYCLGQDCWPDLLTDVRVYSLREDMNARGILDRNATSAKLINYEQFVELCCKYDKTVSWF